jgi:predicted DNA-binding transcriptional regulator YafY
MSLHEDLMGRVSRLFVIYRTLEMRGKGGRIQRRDLQAVCGGCSEKSIQRDLAALNEAGAVICYDRRQGTYVLESPLPVLTIDLQLTDLLALLLSQGVTGAQFGSSAGMQTRALDALQERLPPSLRHELTAAREVLDFGALARRDYSGAPLQDLVAAASSRRTVEMTYYSIGRDATETRRVDPYALTLRNNFPSLVAFCHKRGEVLLFSLDNIRAVRCTEDPFEIQLDFSLASYLKGMVGGMRGELTQIQVLFTPSVARWARKIRWEFPHQMEESDRGLLLSGEVSGLDAFCKEMLRWGARVEVLSPPELRRAMLCEAQALVEMYQDS